MRLTYDPEANMAYLYLEELSPGAVDYGIELDDEDLPTSLVVDIDHDGHVVGIEIFSADRCLSPRVLEQAERPEGGPRRV